MASSSSSTETDPSKLSLIDRVRMFNGLASTSSSISHYRLPSKRPVTSKRFSTQPVTHREHQQAQECKDFYFILFLFLGFSLGLEIF
jgi:hypothetical protein